MFVKQYYCIEFSWFQIVQVSFLTSLFIYLCFEGNWEGSGKFKIWFNHGGAIDFGKVMLTAGKLGINFKFLYNH